jgi:hypothetical protein
MTTRTLARKQDRFNSIFMVIPQAVVGLNYKRERSP